MKEWFVDYILFPMKGIGGTILTLIKCIFYPKK